MSHCGEYGGRKCHTVDNIVVKNVTLWKMSLSKVSHRAMLSEVEDNAVKSVIM